jgi:hypothetical protein
MARAKTPTVTASPMASKPGRARIRRRARRSLRVEPDKVVLPQQGKPLALPVAALWVARVALAASQVHQPVVRPVVRPAANRGGSRVLRPVLRLAAALVVVRKRAAQTGARPSCGVSMNRWAFLMAASGRNSRCWQRTGPRVPERRVMMQVPGPMPRATGPVLPVSPVTAKVAKVAKAARTAV